MIIGHTTLQLSFRESEIGGIWVLVANIHRLKNEERKKILLATGYVNAVSNFLDASLPPPGYISSHP